MIGFSKISLTAQSILNSSSLAAFSLSATLSGWRALERRLQAAITDFWSAPGERPRKFQRSRSGFRQRTRFATSNWFDGEPL